MIVDELEAFIRDHRAHGGLEGDAGDLTENGYMITIACPFGVTFHRWVAAVDAVVDFALHARLK
jgi:hypothetical protein